VSASHAEPCCDDPSLRWEHRLVVDRMADVLACGTCRRTHKIEDWALCLSLPAAGRCTNCGGDLDPASTAGSNPRDSRCLSCGLTTAESKKLHRKLARLHPTGDYLPAANAAFHGGRLVLAFKLATAHLAYVGDAEDAREVRISALESLGLLDDALSEAWNWADSGGSPRVYSMIASIEAGRDNLEATFDALQRGLQIDPQDTSLWTDLAELKAHFDVRDDALEAASYGLSNPALTERCLDVIATIAERYDAEERYDLAIDAINRAGRHKRKSLRISWLTARIAARLQQWDEASAWLRVTLALDPEHTGARDALERLSPSNRSRGIFAWFSRSKGD
jgi:tetratricopeptide (TPR) repeat protein